MQTRIRVIYDGEIIEDTDLGYERADAVKQHILGTNHSNAKHKLWH